MNLRKMTLKYFGWCPGVGAATRFVTDKEIKIPLSMRALTITTVILISYVLIAYALYPPIPEGPLQITVGTGASKQVIFDHEFNNSYDYGLLWGGEWKHREIVTFREKVILSEFASGMETEVENFSFETLAEVCSFFGEDVGAPKVVVGLARFLLNQSIEDTYFRLWDEPMFPPGREFFGTRIGDLNALGFPRGIVYDVVVVRNYHFEDDDTIWEGLWIRKSNSLGSGRYERIWEMRVDAVEIFMERYHNMVLENPGYEVNFIRYPRNTESTN